MDDFLARLNSALGYRVLPADEAGILAEIHRLREAAGELGRERCSFELENMKVAEIRRVPTEGMKAAVLFVTTRPQVVDVTCRSHDGAEMHELRELPRRLVNLYLEEPQAREAHRILDELVLGWDSGD